MTSLEALPLDAEALRADFPILATKIHGDVPLIYFDNAATTQRPRQVIDALRQFDETQYANVHRGLHYLSELSTELYEAARETVQRFLHARSAHEVIFTSGTTAAINLVARSWGDSQVKAGDEILLTEMEHHSNIVPWQQLAARTGCQIKFLPVTDEGTLRLDLLDTFLTERTRLMAVTAASNVLGTLNPIAEITRRVHQAGALILVDGAQSVPHETTDVQQADVDFLALSGHKLLGPSGVGVLYGRESLLESMPPFLGGGSMIHRVTTEGFEPARLPEKFEAGTPPIAPVVGLAVAIGYLERVGLSRIRTHERVLTSRTHELLQDLEGIRLLGPAPDQKGGIVSFVIHGTQPYDLAMTLDEQGVAVRMGHHCAMPLHQRLGLASSVRASFYLYNTLAEVEQFADALRAAWRVLRPTKKQSRQE